VLSIKEIFWALTSRPAPGFRGYRDSALMVICVKGVFLVLVDALGRLWMMLKEGTDTSGDFGRHSR
jgi:hypothetical protein